MKPLWCLDEADETIHLDNGPGECGWLRTDKSELQRCKASVV